MVLVLVCFFLLLWGHAYIFDNVTTLRNRKPTRESGDRIVWNGAALPARRPSLPGRRPPNTCPLGFQVPLLQVVVSRVFPPHPVRLQAALPGTAVHEHHPQVEAVQVQRVREVRWLFTRTISMSSRKQKGLRTTSAPVNNSFECFLGKKKKIDGEAFYALEHWPNNLDPWASGLGRDASGMDCNTVSDSYTELDSQMDVT